MKLHLPLSLYKSLLVLISACTVTTVQAGLMHQDVALQVYTDFGQNKGRYVTSAHANELVQFIRTQEGGIAIPYTDGSAPFYIANEQGMINFAGTGDNGAYAAIAPNAMVTVKHNQPNDASYGEREVGSEHAINYSAIDINGSSVFRLLPDAGNGGTYDYMIQRQSKIVTDAVYNPLTGVDDVSAFKGQYLYHSGAGLMGVYKEGIGYSELAWAYNYTIGGINTITDVWNGSGNNSVISSPGYGDGRGACQENPLPNGIQGGDSGSPVYIYNASTGSYEYVAAQQSGHQQGGDGWSQARGNVKWTRDTLESFNARVTMSPTTSTVYLNAIDTAGETKTEGTNSATLYSGAVKDSTGNELVRYNGVRSGLNTWGDLSTVKDLQNWYAYDSNAYLQRSDAELFFSNNLVFSSNAAENTIVLNDTVDLGIGYAEFNGGKFTITSEDRESNQFNHAGYVINEGAEVHLKLVNPDDYMTEWRKTGAGALYIDGNGNTNALLNVGGSGTTYLQQTGGYAAYNVLASSGATVEIADTDQIKRDFTFGAGGGVLNMNGKSMEWNNSNGTDAAGFTIHALDEQAVVANLSRGTTTELTWIQGGSQTFLGSFRDNGKDSSLQFVYDGGAEGHLTMHSIKTKLTAPGSGITVNSGTLVLAGSHTVHGKGSATGRNGERLYRENDWHYADASAPVTVNGGTFELGSHARLIGDVTVAENATYVMREGVAHALEYVEGGVALEETSKYADYFGHKGHVILNGGKLAVQFNDGVDTNTTYGYNVSGAGDITIDAGNDGGSFTFSGEVTATGKKTVTGGTLLLSGAAAVDNSSGKWLVESAGQMSVDNIDMIDSASTGTLVLSRDTESYLDRSNHSQMLLGAQAGKEVQYGAVGTQETLRDWNLGGAGSLVVNYVVSGSETLTVDGRGHSTGSVKLQQIADDYSGTINVQSEGGRMVLDVGNVELETTVNVKNGGVLRATDAVVSGENNTVELYGNLEYDSFTVRDGATLNLRENGRLDADTAVTIGAGGIMRLNRQTLQDKVELKNGGVMYGNGGTIGSSATVLATEGVGKLNAGSGTFTMDKGTIGAEAGATLRLENGTFNIYSKDINSAGGTLELACSSVYLGYRQNEVTQTIGGTLKVANDLTICTRQGDPAQWQGMTFDINHLHIDASQLTLETGSGEFRHRYNIASLTGSGTIHWKNNMSYFFKGPSLMILTGDNDFSGTLIVDQKCAGGSMQHVGLSHENAAKGMAINLWGDSDSRPGLAVSAKTAQVAGIGGTVNTFVYAGAIKTDWNGDNPASTAHSTLVIDTKGADHVYNGTLLGDAGHGLNLIKDGAGSQTFTNSENVVHDVTALQGSLVFTNAPTIHGDMGVAQGATLQIGTGEFSLDSGETLRVLAGTAGGVATLNNSLVLNGGTIEFGAYDTTTAALSLNGGSISLTEGNTLNLSFANQSAARENTTYLLAGGDWSAFADKVNVINSGYLTATVTATTEGLKASGFSLREGYVRWKGDASVMSESAKVVFVDSYGVTSAELSASTGIDEGLFDNTTDFVLGGASLAMSRLEKSGAGALVLNSAVSATDMVLKDAALISGTGSLSVENMSLQEDIVTGVDMSVNTLSLANPAKWTILGGKVQMSFLDAHSLSSMEVGEQAELLLKMNGNHTILSSIGGAGKISLTGGGHLTKNSDAVLNLKDAELSGAVFKGNGSVYMSGTVDISGGLLSLGKGAVYLEKGANVTVDQLIAGNTANNEPTELTIGAGASLTIEGDSDEDKTTTSFLMAHWRNSDTSLFLNGGTLTANNTCLQMSWDSSGRFEALSGTATLKGIRFTTSSGESKADTFILGGATLNIGSGGITGFKSNDVVELGNGTIAATANFRITHGSLGVVQLAGDTTFDTNGHEIWVDAIMDGEGALTKKGSGTLHLNASNTFSGDVSIEGGTVQIDCYQSVQDYHVEKGSEIKIAHSQDLVDISGLTGSGTLTKTGAGELSIQGNATLAEATIKGNGTTTISSLFDVSGKLNLGTGTVILAQGASVSADQFRMGTSDTYQKTDMRIEEGATLTIEGAVLTEAKDEEISLLLAHWHNSASTLALNGGTLDATNTVMHMGWDSGGTFKANSGDAYLKGVFFSATRDNADNFILGTETEGSARVNIGSEGIKGFKSNDTVKLGCGTIVAAADFSITPGEGGSVQLIGETTFDTEGHTITVASDVKGAGDIIITGTGSLVLESSAMSLTKTDADNGKQSITGKIRVSGNSTLQSSQGGGKHNMLKNLSHVEVNSGNSLRIRDYTWNTIWNVEKLTGDGTLHWNTTTQHGKTDRLIIGGSGAFSGDLHVTAESASAYQAFLQVDSEEAISGALLNLSDTANELDSGKGLNYVALALNADRVKIGGIKGGSLSQIFAGAAPEARSGVATASTRQSTLVLTGSGNYTYSGSIGHANDAAGANGVSIEMAGTGTQTLNGSSLVLNDICVTDGSLNIASDGLQVLGSMSLSKGKLSITGQKSLADTAVSVSGGELTLNDKTSALNSLDATGGNIILNGESNISSAKLVNAHLTINADCEVGKFDAGNRQSSVTLAAGVKLTQDASQSMWIDEMKLGKGAVFTRGEVSIVGQEKDSSVNQIGSHSDVNYSKDDNLEVKNAIVQVSSASAYEIKTKLTHAAVANLSGGKLLLSNSANTLSGLHATKGSIEVTGISSLELEQLEIAAEKTITAATVVVNELAKLEAGATLAADLTLASGATVELGGTMTLSGALELQTGLTLSGTVLDIVKGLAEGESYTLFEGVESLELQQSVTLYNMRSLAEETAGLMSYGSLMEEEQVAAADYFSNLTGNSGLVLSYDSENQTVIITQMQAVPEPTTATLSLLALAALAARRKRK